MAKSGYELWKQEQEKRKQREAAGQPADPNQSVVRNTSGIRYQQPGYTGESATRKDSYQWEKDNLSDLPVKQYGRSYNDKFKNWAAGQGIEENELGEFRRWLDAQEDGVKESSSFMDDILRRKNQNDRESIERHKQNEQFVQELDKKNYQEASKERDGFLGFLDRSVGRFGQNVHKAVFGEDLTGKQDEMYFKNAQAQLEEDMLGPNERGIRNMQRLNAVDRAPETAGEKVADIAGMLTGEAAKYAGAYKLAGLGAKAAGKVAPKLMQKATPKGKFAQDLVRGGAAGSLVGTHRAIDQDLTQDDFGVGDYLKTIGGEALLAGGGDAVIGATIRKLRGPLAKLLEKNGGIQNPTDEQIATAIKAASEPKGNPTNVLASPAKEIPKPFEPQYPGLESRPVRQDFGEVPKVEDPFDAFPEVPAGAVDRSLDDTIGELSKPFDYPGSQELDEILKNQEELFSTVEQANVPQVDDTFAMLDDLMTEPSTGRALDVPNEQPPRGDEIRAVLESNQTPPAPPESKFLLRGNLQQHNPSETNAMFNASETSKTVSAIEDEKFVMGKVDKFYENYVNRNHSATVMEKNLLAKQLKSAMDSGNADQIKEAKNAYKSFKKNGSALEKSITNTQAADGITKTFLEGHFKNLYKSLGKKFLGKKVTDQELAKAFEYQATKRLLYKKKQNPDYQLPKGWDWERLASVEAQGKGKYDDFVDASRNMMQELRDTMYKYDLIDKKAYEALGEDPYYIPLVRDNRWKMNNVDAGYGIGKNSNKRGSDPHVLNEWGEGDLNSFFKNPVESIVQNSFAIHRNALKNDTALQIRRLSELDTDEMFITKITEKEYQEGGGIEVHVDGQKEFLRPQKDMLDLLNENDAGLTTDMLGKVTSFISSLKTRSLEYQTAAVPRDLTESFAKSQAGPLRWFQHAFNAIKDKNNSAKEVGAYFDHAWQDHVGGIDPAKLTKEFGKQNGDQIKVVDLKSKEGWKQVGKTVGKILDAPFKPVKAIGQWSDNLPREIEVLEAQRRFNAKHGEEYNALRAEIDALDNQVNTSQGGDFSDATKGIDSLAGNKAKAESRLKELDRELAREQTYQGRDIMNYGRTGRGKLAQNIRKYVMFANTTTQSKDKLIRQFAKQPVQTTVKTGLVMAPFIYAHQKMFDNMSDSDRAIYDNLPDYVTKFNFAYVQDGEVTVLPKPHELALLTNPIEDMMAGDSLNNSAQLAVKELAPYQTGNALQALVPDNEGQRTIENAQVPSTAFTPLVELLANKRISFNQKPISYSAKYERDLDEQTANDWTPQFLKDILGDVPAADRTDYLGRQYGGDAGKYGIAILDYLLNPGEESRINAQRTLNTAQDRFYRDGDEWFKPIPTKDKDKSSK